MSRTLVFATSNQHKIEEVAQAVGKAFKILSLKDINCTADIEETGTTFEENASIKTHFVFDHFGFDCFGDDSGLEIDALNGAPGVYSARFAGEHGNHEANINKVLHLLENADNRKARFKTVISLLLNGEEYFFEGTVNGSIRTAISGSDGFGYDPVFQPEGEDRTFAEMTLAEKNAISHRGKAMQKLIDFLLKRS